MSSTTFVDKSTVINTNWLNDVNGVVWTLFGGTTSPATARTTLGLGTMATQAASAVAITGGTITGLGTPLPVTSGGTGVTTATGTGNTVLSTSPTITTPSFVGAITQTTTTGGDFISFNSTLASTESALRIDNSQTTSGSALKLSNTGINKQTTLRLNSDGGFTFYVNQTAAGSSTSGTSALTLTGSGGASFVSTLNTGSTLSEISSRVFSRNASSGGQGCFTSSQTNYTAVSNTFSWAHGLSATPVLIKAYAICTDAGGDNGYSQNDVIDINGMSTASVCVTLSANATTVYVALTGQITVANRTTPATYTSLAANKWSVFVRAWY